MKKYTWIYSLSLALLCPTLSFSTAEVPVEKNGLSVEHIKKEVDKLQAFIYKHLGSEEAPSDALRNMPKDAASLMFDKLMSLQTQVTKLVSQLEEMDFKFQQHQKDMQVDKKFLEERLKEFENRLMEKPSLTAPSTEETPGLLLSDEQLYEKAQTLLKSNKLEEGEKLLRQIMTDFPTSPLLSKVYLDLTILLENQSRYEEAAGFAAMIYKKDSQSVEAQQALLKMATMLYKMNKKAEACSVLTKLLTQYPRLEESFKVKANSLKAEYGCA